jgi:hypothetical protein
MTSERVVILTVSLIFRNNIIIIIDFEYLSVSKTVKWLDTTLFNTQMTLCLNGEWSGLQISNIAWNIILSVHIFVFLATISRREVNW